MIIKNYKELCNILETKVVSGNSKIKQLKELELYCNYIKEGNKYIIKEVYKEPNIKIENLLKGKNNKYRALLSNIILEFLYNNPEELKEIPLIKLFSILGITSNNYSIANMYKKEFSQIYDIQLTSMYYFYNDTKKEYKRIIERCLKDLASRSILEWGKCIIIVDKENKKTYKATDEERKEIINVQREVLDYMNYDNMYLLSKNRNDLKKFNDIVSKEIGFNYYYAYNILVGERAIKNEYNKMIKSNVNGLILERTTKIFDKDKYNSYIKDYKLLIDILVNDDNEINESELYKILYHKREENKKKYKEDYKDLNKTYNERLEELKEKYFE